VPTSSPTTAPSPPPSKKKKKDPEKAADDAADKITGIVVGGAAAMFLIFVAYNPVKRYVERSPFWSACCFCCEPSRESLEAQLTEVFQPLPSNLELRPSSSAFAAPEAPDYEEEEELPDDPPPQPRQSLADRISALHRNDGDLDGHAFQRLDDDDDDRRLESNMV